MAIEKQLNAIAGLDEDEAVHFSGRSDGPDFVWQQVGGATASSARTTSASRAWRRSAAWLRRIHIAGTTADRLRACWQLFNYRHPHPAFAAATEEQPAAHREFEAWRTVVGRTYLDDNWVDTFQEMALAKAIRQEGQAQKAQFQAWQLWMHEGPAAGLRKQHQFTKVKGGWVESATVQATEISEEELGIEEGVSMLELRSAVPPAVFGK